MPPSSRAEFISADYQRMILKKINVLCQSDNLARKLSQSVIKYCLIVNRLIIIILQIIINPYN